MILRNTLAGIGHKTIGRSAAAIREKLARKTLSENATGDYFVHNSPKYISQVANADRESIAGFYDKISDLSAAKKFGAKDLEEFSYWAWRSCGIVALQMVLKTILGDKFNKSTMELINECLNLGGYDIKKDFGWYHKSLVELASVYGLKAEQKKFIPASDVALEIKNGNFILSSIKSDTGGHLLLIYGFRLDNKSILRGFWGHDPNDYKENGKAKFILKSDFDNLSTLRIISLNSD